MSLDPKMIRTIIQKVNDEAFEKKQDAAFSGSYDDNGAHHLAELVQVWEDGLFNRIPKQFKAFYEEALKEQDPDYKKFLELKKKFEP